jgi:diketogulonate reductase-like aldo/keto reductase
VRDALQLGYRHFDFELDDEQRGAIASLARGQRTADPSWAPVWD